MRDAALSRPARGLALGILVAFLAPSAERASEPLGPRSAEPAGYESFHSYGGDMHVHSGSPAGAYNQTLSSWNPACIDCPSVWCTRMYSFARQAGYDWVVSTNHEGSLPSNYRPGDPVGGLAMTPQILAWWESARPNYSNPAHPQDVYPTHPAGFPLYDGSGNHTDDQIASLASCADAATENGHFVAFFGIEYTAAPASESGCRTEAVGCGGHKTVIFPRGRSQALGERACTGASGASVYDDQCRTLGQLYRQVAAMGGVVNIAHPNFGPNPGLAPFQATGKGDNGGIDPNVVVGVEMQDFSPELTPGLESTYPGKARRIAGLNIGGFLARGYRVHPVFGSDWHFEPTATSWPVGFSAGATECWARDLTKVDLLDAMRAHRCYFARDGIQVRLTIEHAIMGSSLASDAVDPQQGLRVRLSAQGKSASLGMSQWFLMRGKVRSPIVAPAPIKLASAVSDCNAGGGAVASERCVKDVHVSIPGAATAADYEGFYYVILRRGATEVAVTAPVWVDPPSRP